MGKGLTPELIKAITAGTTALVLLVGGLLYLYATHDHPADTTTLAVVGFMGAAIQWVFSSAAASSAAARVRDSS